MSGKKRKTDAELKERMKLYVQAHPEMRKDIQRRYYLRHAAEIKARHQTPEYRLMQFLASVKHRAKKSGIEFTITKDDISIPSHCPCLGIPLSTGDGVLHDGSPSLDRINPKRGYVPGNVAVISQKANRIKNDGDAEEILRVAIWLKNQTCQPACASLPLLSPDTAVFPSAQT